MSHGLGVVSPLDEEADFLTNQKLAIVNHQSSINLLAHDSEAGADHRSLAERDC